MTTIHPTALVSADAQIGNHVVIEPFCVVEADVQIDDGCHLASHAVIKSGTTLGQDNKICESAVVGGLPQHVQIPECVGRLEIGDRNVIREYCTLHRSLHADGLTQLGSDNLLMVGAHVAHDCTVGDHVILTNGVQLAGHVEVHDRAFLSAGVGVHQFARIGCHAMVGGHGRVVRDVPPFMTMDGGTSLIVGLNLVGLRRNQFTSEQIQELKAAYRVIYRQGLTFREAIPVLQERFSEGPAARMHEFLSGGSRGFTPERRAPPGATVRLHRESDEADAKVRDSRKAG